MGATVDVKGTHIRDGHNDFCYDPYTTSLHTASRCPLGLPDILTGAHEFLVDVASEVFWNCT